MTQLTRSNIHGKKMEGPSCASGRFRGEHRADSTYICFA